MAAPSSSVKAVLAALAANSFVTVIKFVAFALSGSGAMLSEAIHSAADTGNQLLLFIGLKRGAREPDDRFHYGYGGERFVFGMLSAAGIFFIGCGITIYHGVSSLISPHMPQLTITTFAVLGVSFVVEGSVLMFAVRSIAKQRGDIPFFRYVRTRADPATVAGSACVRTYWKNGTVPRWCEIVRIAKSNTLPSTTNDTPSTANVVTVS